MYGSQTLKMFMLCAVMINSTPVRTRRTATLAGRIRKYQSRSMPNADQAARSWSLRATRYSAALVDVGMLINVSTKPVDKDALI
jgi:hypothetical protein